MISNNTTLIDFFKQNFSGSVLLEGLLVDIAVQLDEIIRQPHNSCAWFLSPQKLENTLSQVYFLLVGKCQREIVFVSQWSDKLRFATKGNQLTRLYCLLAIIIVYFLPSFLPSREQQLTSLRIALKKTRRLWKNSWRAK